VRRRPLFRWPSLRFLTPLIACGALLALCGLPLSWSALTPIPLALALWLMARAETPRSVAASAFWLMSTYFAVQLWWLTRFMADLSGLPWGGMFVLPLFFLEGAFWALMAWLVCLLFTGTLARVWALAAGWVVLEWLRTTGPLAFPWSDLGYTLLPTPLAQTADVWGALGLSLLVVYTAVALVSLAMRRYAAPLVTLLLWAGGWVYGSSRVNAPGPLSQAFVIRSQFDSFGRASGQLTTAQQFQKLSQLSQERRPGELLIWSETALQQEMLLPLVPAPGIYGVRKIVGTAGSNTAQSWDGTMPGSVVYTKLKPVPMGEYFPLSEAARPLYGLIFKQLGFFFDPPPVGQSTLPLVLNGVRYGTYICYDSIFSWVPRQMVRNGAQVLINISNDGWYKGWGVRQHFQMGRLRAIETRRWVLRSVNEGVAASIDDLGRPVQTLDAGEGGLHVTYRVLNGQTLYVRLGDWPALLLALCLLIPAVRAERRSGKQLL
jgi:apolipoprotein N-acyltransferase